MVDIFVTHSFACSEQDEGTITSWIKYDGRLYYKGRLCRSLSKRGIKASANQSDEELILLAYQAWQVKCVNYLEGDYAFIIYDADQRTLFAARSPLGARPLFYYEQPEGVTYASKVQQLFYRYPFLQENIDTDWIAWYCTTGNHLRGTLFRDIQEVLPGTYTLFSQEKKRFVRYWQPSLQTVKYRNKQDYIEHFRDLLTESIRERVTGEGQVLCDLSGGLDSSTTAVLATHFTRVHAIHGGTQLHTEHDGHLYAQLVADRYTIPMRTIFYEDEAPTYTDLGTDAWTTVPTTPSIQFIRYYQKAIEEAHRVGARFWLRGGFADSLYLGDMSYLYASLEEKRYAYTLHELYTWARQGRIKEAFLDGLLYPSFQARRQAGHSDEHNPDNLTPWIDTTMWEQSFAIEQEEQEQYAGYPPFQRSLRKYIHRHTECTSFDHGFRTHGIEIVDPYTDLRLIEFVLRCPAHVQMKQRETKHLIREVARGILPEEVHLRRSKGGISRVLFADLQRQAPHFLPLLQSVPEPIASLFDHKRFAQEVKRVLIGGCMTYEPAFFSTLTLALWSQQFFTHQPVTVSLNHTER